MKNQKSTRRSPKRRRSHTKKKQIFRTRNWSEYNRSLVDRGSLTIWCDERVLQEWSQTERTGRRGASDFYSDSAIIMALTIKAVYRQTLRGTQGLLRSVLQMMKLSDLPVPDYSTLCRRGQRLEVPLGDVAARGAVHLVVDSTGCKVFGEGEWKVRQHGYSKRRTWRKLHLGIDSESGQIKAAIVTTNDITDGEKLPDMLEQVVEPIRQVSGDGSYDKRTCYTALKERLEKQGQPLKVAIPPQHRARIWQHGNTKGERLARDENLRRIRQVGRAKWKEEADYHRRSLAETGVFRYKTTFGDELNARCFDNQATEVFIRCRILNLMNQMGKPESYMVELA